MLNYDPPGTTLHYGGPTNLERALYAMLEEEGVAFIPEWCVPGSSYRLDAFDPETLTGYEADGPTHFSAKGRRRDRERDAFILATGRVRRIVRLTVRELRTWM